jgi:hypothetical protein
VLAERSSPPCPEGRPGTTRRTLTDGFEASEVVLVRRLRGGRETAARVSAVDRYQFPEAVAERFRHEHPEVHPEDTALIEAAARQWFRLIGREPRRALALPSRAVSDWWLAFLHAEDAYRQFCQDACGEFVPHRPPPSGPGEDVADGAGLVRTLKSARRDEPEAPNGLPWLFRVDAKVQILNARRYISGCGGGPECYSVAGSICLHHLAGFERPLRHTYDPSRDKPAFRPESPG